MITTMKQPYRFIIDALFFLALSPFAWWLADREPPWIRIWGEIQPTRAGDLFSVHWHTTPLSRECPGTLQVEVMSGYVVWPVLRRQVNSELNIGQIDYIAPPWPLAISVPRGTAKYRVTSFWFCNWMQEWLNWPIIQVGPDVEFEVLPAEIPLNQKDTGPAGPAGPRGPAGATGPQGLPGENKK